VLRLLQLPAKQLGNNDLDRSADEWAADVALMASSDLFLNPHYVACNHIEPAAVFSGLTSINKSRRANSWHYAPQI
jgi:hypothetical protein